MTFTLNRQSQARLGGVHPDLVKVVRLAIEQTPIEFQITEGLRSAAREAEMVASGKSETMNSMHIQQPDGFGHAVDVCAIQAGKAVWDMSFYTKIAAAFQDAADELEIPITWGGSWKTLKDGCHIELDQKHYQLIGEKHV